MSTLLQTESGLTRFSIGRGHRLFSTLLSMYDGHEMPEVITLIGSVGTIFDEEYRSFCSRIDSFVPLSKVKRILQVLDVQPVDLLNICVDDGCTRDERFQHYELVGTTVSDNRLRESLLSSVLGLLSHVLSMLYDDVLESGSAVESTMGAIHNAIIASSSHTESVFSPELIRWDDLFSIAESNNLKHSIKPLRLLAGRGTSDGDYSSLTGPSILRIPLYDGKKSHFFIYRKYLDLIPKDANTADLGCIPLVGDITPFYDGRVSIPVNDIVQDTNTQISFRIAQCVGVTPLIHSVLGEYSEWIGREGIRRMLVALRREYDKHSGMMTKLHINALESYLGGRKTSRMEYCLYICISMLVLLVCVRLYALLM